MSCRCRAAWRWASATARAQTIADYSRAQRALLESTMAQAAARSAGLGASGPLPAPAASAILSVGAAAGARAPADPFGTAAANLAGQRRLRQSRRRVRRGRGQCDALSAGGRSRRAWHTLARGIGHARPGGAGPAGPACRGGS